MRLTFLIFKQGFKSIFKYKIQFFIVMILVFLASFYLAITISTNSRVNQLYDDVISENGKKFDYTLTRSNGTSNSILTDNNDVYIMMNDFVNNQYVSVENENSDIKTSSNFLVSDNSNGGGSNSQISEKNDLSFVQKAFASDLWKEQFKLLYVYANADQKTKWEANVQVLDKYGYGQSDHSTGDPRYGELGFVVSRYSIDPENGNELYIPTSIGDINSSNGSAKINADTSKNSTGYFQRTVSDIIGILIDYFNKEVDESINNLNKDKIEKLPLALQYFSKNIEARTELKNIISDFNIEGDDWNGNGWSRLWISSDNWGNTVWGKKYNNDKLFAYLYNAFSTIAYSFIDEIMKFEASNFNAFKAWDDYKTYYNNFYSSIVNFNYTSKQHFIIDGNKDETDYNNLQNQKDNNNLQFAGYNSWVNGDVQDANTQPTTKYLPLYNLDDNSSDSPNKEDFLTTITYDAIKQHLYADWAEIFGTDLNDLSDYDSQKSDYDKMLMHGDKNDSYKLNINYGDDLSSQVNNELNTASNGYRGFINPISYFKDANNLSTKSKVEYNFNILGRFENNGSFQSSRAGINYDYDTIQMNSFYNNESTQISSKRSIFAMEKFRNDMAASLTNINASLREEYFYYDPGTQRNFRFVVLDQNEINKKNQYYKIVEGVEPVANNEILINEQYAIKNNIKIGQTIKIAQNNEIVSGFAVDTLSYYPIGDLNISIPDVEKTGIVYITKKSLQNFAENASISNSLTSTNYWFYSGINENNNIESNLKTYNSLINNNQTGLNVSSDIIERGSGSPYWNGDWKNSTAIIAFDKTNWIKNWTIQPLFTRAIIIVSYITAAIIILLVFFAISYAIKKNIQQNVSQIAYLKCMGIKSWELSFSYIGYSLISSFLIIPIGWVAGGILQELLVRMFMQYISTSLYKFIFDWKLLLTLLGVIGVLTFVMSILIALYYNSQPILKIVNGSKAKKLKYKKNNKLFKLIGFKWILNIRIAQRNKGTVTTFTATTFILVLFVTIFTLLPSMFNKYINDSKKFFKYDNAYLRNSPYENSPLSKTAVGAWSGPDYLENEDNANLFKNSIMEDYVKNYYNSDSDFSDSSTDSSIIPTLNVSHDSSSYDEYLKNINWASQYIYSNSEDNDDSNSFIALILENFLSKIANLNGLSLSMGDLERIEMIPAYLKYNITNNNQEFKNSAEREIVLSNASALLGKGLPVLLKTFIHDIDNLPETDDWRDTLFYLIQSYIPNTMMKYFSNSTRTSQFSFMINSDNYIPGKETLSTTTTLTDFSKRNWIIDGLKDNQEVYNLNGINTSKIFLDNKTINEFKILFNSVNFDDISKAEDYLSNKGLYDKNTKTVIIPTIANKSAANDFDFSDYITMNTNYLSAPIENQDSYVSNDIPKGAWVYDNRDYEAFKNGWSINENHINDDSNSFLDPFAISSSKFGYEYQFQDVNNRLSLKSGTTVVQLLKQNIDDNGDLSYDFEQRPVYNYGNIRLYFPKDAVSNISKIALIGDPNFSTGEITDDNAISNQGGWYGEANAEDVPQSVKDAWAAKTISGQAPSTDYIWVDPYNFQYSKLYSGSPSNGKSTRHGDIKITDLEKDTLINFGSNIGDGANYSIQKQTGILKYPNVSHVKLNNTAKLNTFNDNVLIADQDLINLVLGYNIDKYIGIDNSSLNHEPSGTQNIDNNKTIKTYEYKNTLKMNDVNFDAKSMAYGINSLFNGNVDVALKNDTQSMWFNNKYSQFDEPIGVSTGLKTDMTGGTGFMSASYLDNELSNMTSAYTSITLASARTGIIISASKLILAICYVSIFGILIIASLYLILMSDSFVSEFARFILIMKALGYTNKEIVTTVISIQGFLNIFAFVIGAVIGGLIVNEILNFVASSFSIAIPYVIVWYIPIVIIMLIVASYSLATIIALQNSIRESPVKIFKD